MKAIKVTFDNLKKIEESSPLLDKETVAVMGEFVEDHDRYFIMNVFDMDDPDKETDGWATYPEDDFANTFEIRDKGNIETEFVNIVLK